MTQPQDFPRRDAGDTMFSQDAEFEFDPRGSCLALCGCCKGPEAARRFLRTSRRRGAAAGSRGNTTEAWRAAPAWTSLSLWSRVRGGLAGLSGKLKGRAAAGSCGAHRQRRFCFSCCVTSKKGMWGDSRWKGRSCSGAGGQRSCAGLAATLDA